MEVKVLWKKLKKKVLHPKPIKILKKNLCIQNLKKNWEKKICKNFCIQKKKKNNAGNPRSSPAPPPEASDQARTLLLPATRARGASRRAACGYCFGKPATPLGHEMRSSRTSSSPGHHTSLLPGHRVAPRLTAARLSRRAAR